MKSIIFVALSVLLPGFALAQDAPAADSLFIVTYTTGPAWNSAKPPNEQVYFKEHSANLSAWRKAGIIRFGARFADKGIIFLSERSLQAARERITGDQGVASGLFVADVQPLSPFYYGCIEKAKP